MKNKWYTVHKVNTDNSRQLILDVVQIKYGDASSEMIPQENDSVYYHKSCLTKAKHAVTHTNKPKLVHKKNITNHASFKYVHNFIQQNILRQQKIYLFSDIYEIYKEKYHELQDSMTPIMRKDYLLKKLKDCHKNLKTILLNKTCVVYCAKMAITDLYRQIKLIQDKSAIKSAAYAVRAKIIQINANSHQIPADLLLLIRSIIMGPKQSNNPRLMKKIGAISDFIVNCTTRGSIRTQTCVGVGLVVKSKTGSKELIDILNTLGVSISYSLVYEIETELAYHESNSSLLPMGIKAKMPNLCSGLAFDNYDRYVETASGRDTLHDTVGIMYQNISTDSNELPLSNLELALNVSTIRNRRRKYESTFNHDIPVYFKRNKPFPALSRLPVEAPINITEVIMKNDIWMMHFLFAPGHAKQWNAWNAQYTTDMNPQQIITYLPQLNSSPTNDRTIHKTLEIAEEIRVECGQSHLFLTYDLAMAKPAYKIQIDCAPKFNSIFISLGPFHVELTFFKAIGKYIDESGLPKLLVLSELVSEGSLSGIISGKHFSRCKKNHIIVSLAFKVLHFKRYLQDTENNEDFDVNEIAHLIQNYNACDEDLKNLSGFCKKYHLYFQDTLNGLHGKTPQFVASYIYMIDVYLLYETALRTSNVDLFIYASSKMLPYFFILNHQNYARYLTRNIDNLVNMDLTHPGLSNQLRNGALSIRRTPKNFARNAVDITLEQTINANAANKLTGISAFTNSIATRNKWAETHSTRMAIIRDFYELIGFIKKQDVGDTAHENRNFKQKVTKFIKTVEETFNPFEKEISPEHLFNLTTGKAASQPTADFLLNLKPNGIKKMDQFITECNINLQRFEQPINRTKVLNFATEILKPKKASPLSNKINAVETEKFIIGRLLSIAIEKKIDLGSILKFPLTNVPYSLAQFDGTLNMYHSYKDISTLFEMERNCIHKDDLNITIDVINGTDFLLSLNDAPNTYGKLALLILRRLCESTAHEIHIFFESKNTRIRNYEEYKKQQMYDDNSIFEITGFNQERASSLKKSLVKSTFRNTLVEFILKTWDEHDSVPSILNDKRVFISFGSNCCVFSKDHGNRKQISTFSNNHLDVESRMMLHISKMSERNILVKIQQPDNFIINMLYHMQHMPDDVNIYIETGNVDRNTSRLIDIRKMYHNLSIELIASLPAWHIFTGNGYEPCFFGKGKRSSFKLLQKSTEYQDAFSKLGLSLSIDANVYSTIESFTCRIYKSNKNYVNEARVEHFDNIIMQQCPTSEKGNIILLLELFFIILNL